MKAEYPNQLDYIGPTPPPMRGNAASARIWKSDFLRSPMPFPRAGRVISNTCGWLRDIQHNRNEESMESGVAQWLACWAHNSKVGGSKPLSAIKPRYATVFHNYKVLASEKVLEKQTP